MLLFGPAGAVVFGAVGGTGALFGSGWAREKIDQVLIADWVRALDDPSEDFRMALKRAMRGKIQILQNKVKRLGSLDGELVPWIRLRLLDNAVAIAEGVAELDFDIVEREQPTRARELLRMMKDAGVHPWSVQEELAGLVGRLAERPSVGDVVRGQFDGAMSVMSKIKLPWRSE